MIGNWENTVISGDYEGKEIVCANGMAVVKLSFFRSAPLNARFALGYEMLADLGDGRYHIKVDFKDGKSSIIQADEELRQALSSSF